MFSGFSKRVVVRGFANIRGNLVALMDAHFPHFSNDPFAPGGGGGGGVKTENLTVF